MSKSEGKKKGHHRRTTGQKDTRQSGDDKAIIANNPQIQLFKEAVALPKFATDSIAKILFVSSLLTEDWETIVGTLYEIPSFSEKMDTKKIYSHGSHGMSSADWNEISTYLSESDLKHEKSGVLEKKDKHLKMFSQRISGSFGKNTQLDSLTLAKLYLIAYSPDYTEFLKSVIPSTPYGTRKEFQLFLESYPSPQISSLCTILEYLK